MESKFPLFSERAKSGIMLFEKYAVFLRDDDIIQIQMKDNFDGKLADSQKMLECIIQLSNNKKYPLLSIYGHNNSFTKEAKDFVANSSSTLADGLVGFNVIFNLLGNLYIKINQPNRPTRLFSNVENAVEWLKQFNSY